MENLIPRPAHSLTCVLICYVRLIRRHVSLSYLTVLEGIVKIHFKKKRNLNELGRSLRLWFLSLQRLVILEYWPLAKGLISDFTDNG